MNYTDSNKKEFYKSMTAEEVKCIHKYFNFKYLYLLNEDVIKISEGRDLDVSDASFYEIQHFNDALSIAPKYEGKLYIGVNEKAYKELLKSIDTEIVTKSFSFGYLCRDKSWARYITYISKTSVSKEWLHVTKEGLIDAIFPQETTFKVKLENEVLILEEV